MNHDDIVNDVTEMLERAEVPASDECCIYRVPSEIRRLKEDAYTPKVVSIGPFHRGHSRLQNMERYKLMFCRRFIERANTYTNTNTTLDSLIHCIEGVELSFRMCYSETLDFTQGELVKMILVDSCFILELFWRYYYDDPSETTFLLKPWLSTAIRLDLLLLENQLPFFVLDKLFDLSFSPGSSHNRIPSFIEFAFDYFDYYNRSNLGSHEVSIKHFTDLIRTFHLQHPPERRPARTDESPIHLNSATELLEAGVRFKVNTKNKCLLDLRFHGRVLEIPQLKVEDWTEILFRNMVALEQCHYPLESYITDYVAMLDFLINTSRDVDVLVRKKVLVNWLGDSDSVANLFNSLWKNITHSNFNEQYFHLCQRLNGFCRDPVHKLKATLRHDYCNTPWQTAASIAGIVLLILSLIQSVCSVWQVILQKDASPPPKT